jgi:predicted ATPase/class 3 adenylate cyclase
MSASMETAQPSGTITFLFTDIEGSTKLAQENPDAWDSVQERHHDILQAAMRAHNGSVFQVIGDAFCVAFDVARDGLEAALEAQRRLQSETWGNTPVKVRMGLHTGTAQQKVGGYRGYLTMARVQRVMSAAYGGQILLSRWTADSLDSSLPDGVDLRDLQEHRLKGFTEPERLWQVVAPDLPQDFPPLPTLKKASNNLPIQATRLIGRDKETAEVAEHLANTRLLTLTGSGGTGKTRLALEVAERIQDRFKDGVWFIDLAPLSDPGLVPGLIANVLGMQEEPGQPILPALVDWLRDKELLLVMDNCEHLIQACAEVADATLRACRSTRILATSIEPLRVPGEMTYRVPSLSTPASTHPSEASAIKESAAVQLFVDRAIQASSSFKMTDKNASAVAQICYRLDGIPLAIELAAARTSALAADQIAARLDDRFRLLARGSSTALPRHQTLRAMIDWSYGLLSEFEQALLHRVSVFAGGWTLEAAEQVCGPGDMDLDVLTLLANLVDKSLVVVDETEQGARYRLLESTRQYAQEKLVAAGQEGTVRNRHIAYFLALAETAETHLRDDSQVIWLTRLESELNNLRGALMWSQNGGNANDGLRLATALHWFWNLRSLLTEGHEWLARTLRLAEAGEMVPKLKARALYRLAHLAHYLGEPIAHRRARLAESLQLNRELQNLEGCGHTLVMLAWITEDPREAEALYAEALECSRRSDFPWLVPATFLNMADLMLDLKQNERALAYLNECIPGFRALGDRWGIAWSLLLLATIKIQEDDYEQVADLLGESTNLFGELKFNVGVRLVILTQAKMEFKKGDFDKAARLFEEHLSLAREMGLKNSIADGLLRLGNAVCHQGEYGRAAALIIESLQSFKQRGFLSQIPVCLGSLARVRAAQGKPAVAATLLAAAETQREALGRPLIPVDVEDWTGMLEAVRAQMDAPTFSDAVADGKNMTLEQAVSLALVESAG